MANDSLSDPDEPGDDSFLRRHEGPIDFFRSYRGQRESDLEGLLSEVESDQVMDEIVEKASQLIREYQVTAKHVGAALDEEILLKVLEALQRESQGDPEPAVEFFDEEPTERFLAESLFQEILELPQERASASGKENILLSRESWRVCLDHLADLLED